MVLYECPRCNYTTKRKSCFTDHLDKKFICTIAEDGINVDRISILDLLENPLTLKQRFEIEHRIEKLEKENKEYRSLNITQGNTIQGNHNTITDNSTDNRITNNITLVLNLNDTNTQKIEELRGIKDFQDLVKILHSFEENKNIYKPNINKDKRIRALMDNGWITYKSLEHIPMYLETLKDIIDLTIRPDMDDTLNMDDKEIINQVNMGLYDIGRKYKMNN